MEVDIHQILAFDEKQIFNVTSQHSHNAYACGFVHSLQTQNCSDTFQLLITQLQDENKYLRSQIQELMSLLKSK